MPECGEAILEKAPSVAPRVLTVLAALSLVLCVVVSVLWVRSYSGDDVVRRDRDPGGWRLFSLNGRVGYDNAPAVAVASARQAEYEIEVMIAEASARSEADLARARSASPWFTPRPAPPAPPLPPRPPPPTPRRSRSIPYALVLALLAVLPVLWVERRLAARRRAARGR